MLFKGILNFEKSSTELAISYVKNNEAVLFYQKQILGNSLFFSNILWQQVQGMSCCKNLHIEFLLPVHHLSIPLEDLYYNLSMLLPIVFIHEVLMEYNKKRKAK